MFTWSSLESRKNAVKLQSKLVMSKFAGIFYKFELPEFRMKFELRVFRTYKAMYDTNPHSFEFSFD
jgi:hypothetical protein